MSCNRSLAQAEPTKEPASSLRPRNNPCTTDDALENLVEEIRKGGFANVSAVMPGAETGVKLCDRLSERLGVRTNGAAGTEARRNKFDMGEKVRAAGVRAVMQVQATTWGEIQTFLDGWELTKTPEIFEAIVKVRTSIGNKFYTLNYFWNSPTRSLRVAISCHCQSPPKTLSIVTDA